MTPQERREFIGDLIGVAVVLGITLGIFCLPELAQWLTGVLTP